MILRQLGASGLMVSPIGLGLAALGRPGYINIGHSGDLSGDGLTVDAMQEHAHQVLDAAWDSGIRYFDAARSYGLAEAFLSSWLRARGKTDVTVGSKWGYTYTAAWQVDAPVHEVKEHSAAVLERQLAETTELLGGHLGLYQIHSATLESGVLDNKEVLKGLAQLKARGVRIGLSLSGAAQGDTLRRALEVECAGMRLFDAVQATWNLLETSAGPALAEAHAAGVGVIVKEALANGRLTERNTDADFAPKMEILREEATRLGSSVDAVALAAVLAQPWVDVVLSGAATVEQMKSNTKALEVRLDSTASTRLQSLAEDPKRYWATRSSLKWN